MIEVNALTKRYGEVTAVADVSFRCEPGTVTGFLGPNGAGKSTTLRMICGLTPPTSGDARVLGVPYRRIANPGRHVGVMLDASAQHPGRTGRETLALAARLLGVDAGRAEEMLRKVGLPENAVRRRVGGYSLGMRQRLGIAQALLGDPRVLILDEPANGLDPEGIHWMRTLLRDFADRGGTVLLSSHLLREVEAVADRFVVIAGGRIVAQGTRGELLSAREETFVRGLEPGGLETALAEAGLDARRSGPDGFRVRAGAEAVGRAAAKAGAVLLELRPAGDGGLEELFLSLTAPPKEPREPKENAS
ncbi:ABC transporter ATP-binding protein [Thermomonospora cellulosilytica]|uniref:ABC-2 type transport system ATP-binding protein n=1 Tax=Thermomonospora cellulosilytica TaxID=1411118 RepID=A0A7W3N112_9ACTN|nr:ABC transporter ATP-binding protein [Thermomonospora cellulosilytica]MBA9005497.1 ABC-2 type transport system ATP-binding protein [Thermomonospora cellulosilytica]